MQSVLIFITNSAIAFSSLGVYLGAACFLEGGAIIVAAWLSRVLFLEEGFEGSFFAAALLLSDALLLLYAFAVASIASSCESSLNEPPSTFE